MEYFDKITHNNERNKHTGFIANLEDAKKLYEELEIGKFDKAALATLLDENRKDMLTKAVELPVLEDLDRLKVQNRELRQSNLEAATKDKKELVEQIDKLISNSPIGCDFSAYTLDEDEICLSSEWLNDLKEKYTVRADTSKRKEFAKAVYILEEAYNTVLEILPEDVKPFAQEKQSGFGPPAWRGKTTLFLLEGINGREIVKLNTEVLKIIK